MTEPDTVREAGQDGSSPSIFGRAFQVIGIGAMLLLALFMLQNLQQAEVNFLWFDWRVRMVWALLVSAVFGALGSLLTYVVVARLRRRPPPDGS